MTRNFREGPKNFFDKHPDHASGLWRLEKLIVLKQARTGLWTNLYFIGKSNHNTNSRLKGVRKKKLVWVSIVALRWTLDYSAVTIDPM